MTDPQLSPDAEALERENKALRDALAFYADEKNHQSPSTGFALQYDPVPPPVRADKGAKARSALGDA